MYLSGENFTLGIISDTHNLLRPEAVEKLKGSDLIVHAGDIGDRKILDDLEKLAPTLAVRGNVDSATWCESLPPWETVTLGKVKIYVIHNLKELAIDLQKDNIQIVVSGHSHKPLIESKNGVLFINPGSAGKRRFKLPITLATAEITGRKVDARIVELCQDLNFVLFQLLGFFNFSVQRVLFVMKVS